MRAAGHAARILIVDDNDDATRTLALLLGELGHTTSVVMESRQALATALAFKPEVMFLDLGMPHLNGSELARQIRGHAGLKDVYLAALSGWGTEEDRAGSRDAGIDHHLAKPVMVDAMAQMLADVVR